MEVVVSPPTAVLWIALAISAVVTAVVLYAARNQPLFVKLPPILLALAASGAVVHYGYRPARFAWDEHGIRDDAFGPERTLAWSEVEEAHLVRGWASSGSRLAVRTNGIATDRLRAGFFELADGTSARVFALADADDVVRLRTADETWILSPPELESFIATVRAHVRVPLEP